MIAAATLLAIAAILLGLVLLAFGLLWWFAEGLRPIPRSGQGALGCLVAAAGLAAIVAGIMQVMS